MSRIGRALIGAVVAAVLGFMLLMVPASAAHRWLFKLGFVSRDVVLIETVAVWMAFAGGAAGGVYAFWRAYHRGGADDR